MSWNLGTVKHKPALASPEKPNARYFWYNTALTSYLDC